MDRGAGHHYRDPLAILITLIHVSSFHIDLRYIFPALVFIPVLFALCMQQAVNGIPVNKVRRPR